MSQVRSTITTYPKELRNESGYSVAVTIQTQRQTQYLDEKEKWHLLDDSEATFLQPLYVKLFKLWKQLAVKQKT